jgi:UDP-N-acetylglucosamine 2-epimerase (non-hydrolysing)
MKVLSVVGARPNFMKVAPIIAAIARRNGKDAVGFGEHAITIQHVLVHTGQHYDDLMSGSFFSDLSLPRPDVHLGVGSGSHAVQTAEIMKKFENVLVEEKPDIVVVVGDVNSTLACSLVAAKLTLDSSGTRPLIAHVEAGLRSFDRSMPEEINRIVTDHLADLLFVTEESGVLNLYSEGIQRDHIHFVGNTMIDSLLAFRDKADASTILDRLGLRTQAGENGASSAIRPYALLTLHRPSNVDNREIFLNILAGLEELSQDCPVVFPVHPRTRRRIEEFGLNVHFCMTAGQSNGHTQRSSESRTGIIVTDPMGYLDFLSLMKHSTMVVTDSGGIQEETTCLGIPCVTVRENTERPVTVENGTNEIAGTSKDGIKQAIQSQLVRKNQNTAPEKWDGNAAQRILDVLIRAHNEKSSSRQNSQLQCTTLNSQS